MWLNQQKINEFAICGYRESLLNSCPNHMVIDGLFDESKLEELMKVLRHPFCWETQQHTYSALNVDNDQWQEASIEQRFVQRDVWQRDGSNFSIAHEFLEFLRGNEFMSALSRIFNVQLTDMNVAKPDINTNFFRIGANDFVEQHADDSPGREVCMLLYLNKQWRDNEGGKLVFMGKGQKPVCIEPLYNRCVLFDPSSEGAEHWVEKLNAENTDQYRYNVTSWYWSE
jgi:SM-20-related protein